MKKTYRPEHSKLLKIDDRKISSLINKPAVFTPYPLECECELNHNKEKLVNLLNQLAITQNIIDREKLQKEADILSFSIARSESRINFNKQQTASLN